MSDLDHALLMAHDSGDGQALVTLYTQAADAATDEDAQSFYLTHAMVFALEIGDPRATDLRSKLVSLGREVPV